MQPRCSHVLAALYAALCARVLAQLASRAKSCGPINIGTTNTLN